MNSPLWFTRLNGLDEGVWMSMDIMSGSCFVKVPVCDSLVLFGILSDTIIQQVGTLVQNNTEVEQLPFMKATWF